MISTNMSRWNWFGVNESYQTEVSWRHESRN